MENLAFFMINVGERSQQKRKNFPGITIKGKEDVLENATINLKVLAKNKNFWQSSRISYINKKILVLGHFHYDFGVFLPVFVHFLSLFRL